MGSKAPPVPREQRSSIGGAASPDGRDAEVSRDPSRDKSGLNLKEQDRHGNLRQNLGHHQQDR